MQRRCTVDSPIGPVLLVADDEALRFADFHGGSARPDLLERAEDPGHPVLAETARQLREYFDGLRTSFDLPLRYDGSAFERAAWAVLCEIPFGESISYGEQAMRAGRPGGAQAAGAANGRNPIAIVIPCHRVVGADGSMVGFGGGIAIKQWLLDHERGTPQLFDLQG